MNIFLSPTTEVHLVLKEDYSAKFKKFELFEGGGGYRKKIYRAAHDCLLRRKIGDTTLPVKTKRVALCPICELSLNNLIN